MGDEIFPLTRIVAAILVVLLALAFIILYLFPNDTDEFWAWTIRPAMSPMLMGSGYIAGAYYFTRMAAGGGWHRLGVPLPAVAVFATSMEVLTFLHWDRFNHDHAVFFLWIAIYTIAPPLVLGLWIWNRREDPGLSTIGYLAVPQAMRWALLASGVVSLAIALWLFLFPDSGVDVWPWMLSPLTSRTMSGWIALGGTASVLLGRDPRWSAWKIPFETTLLWAALVLLAVFRARGDFNWDRPASWLFLLIVSVWVASFAAVLVIMEGRRRSAVLPAEAAP